MGMKVYWTKELTYDTKRLLEDFCKKHDLIKEWRKGTDNNQGHYNLIDLNEKEETEQHILNFCTAKKIKITNRSNDTAAMTQFKNQVYSISQEGASFENIIELIDDIINESEKKWCGKIDKDNALAYIKKQENKENTYLDKHIARGKEIFSGDGKVLLIGAYADLNNHSERLLKVVKFLEGFIDQDCLIYEHKSSFYFCTFDDEKTNLSAVVKYFKKQLLQLLNEEYFDYDEIFSFNKNDFTEALSKMRHENGGGFKDLSDKDEVVLSFLRSNNLSLTDHDNTILSP